MAVQQIGLSDEMEQCVDSCTEAVEVCEWCAGECVDHGEGMAECIRLCRDVADIASLCAPVYARSEFNSRIAEACAQASEACAEECESHDHEHCQACAEILPQCAESCRAMT